MRVILIVFLRGYYIIIDPKFQEMSLSFSTVQKFILHRMGPYQDKHLTSIFSCQYQS